MRELHMQSTSLSEIRDAIHALRQSEEVLVIRGGALQFPPDKWKEILRDVCQLRLDKRQYNFSEQLELVDWWEISYQPDKATSYAYSNTRQPFHTDNAWFSDPAEINFFIMQKQASAGGEQTLYPLSRLMEDLSSEEPALFDDLCHTTVIIKKGDGQYFNRTSVIVRGDDPRIFWNYFRTEKPTAEIKAMCDAFFRYLEKKESTSSIERRHSKTGDCICFNDQKTLHGRAAFTATKPFDRILLQSMWWLPK
jgi:alpha-ketoglutarate-dependent taurine dioxygenase